MLKLPKNPQERINLFLKLFKLQKGENVSYTVGGEEITLTIRDTQKWWEEYEKESRRKRKKILIYWAILVLVCFACFKVLTMLGVL